MITTRHGTIIASCRPPWGEDVRFVAVDHGPGDYSNMFDCRYTTGRMLPDGEWEHFTTGHNHRADALASVQAADAFYTRLLRIREERDAA